jgi:hypothetical protein
VKSTAGERKSEDSAGGKSALELQRADFGLEVSGHLSLIRQGDSYLASHFHEHFVGPVLQKWQGQTEIPASLFSDQAQAEKFASRVQFLFNKTIASSLSQELILLHLDVIHYVLDELGIGEIDLKEQAAAHARETKKNALRRFKLQPVGRPPVWTRIELARAILEVIKALPSKRGRTQGNVVRILKEKHGGRAPQSVDGLRDQLDRLGLDWKLFKNGGNLPLLSTVLSPVDA